MHVTESYFSPFNPHISPFLNVNVISFEVLLFKFPGYAELGSFKSDVNVSSPPTLVPHKPLLIEYFAAFSLNFLQISIKN